MHRRVQCVNENGTVVDDTKCDGTTRPEKMRREAKPCRATWAVGAWSKVSILIFIYLTFK